MVKKNYVENVYIDYLFCERNLGVDKGLFIFKVLKILNNYILIILGEILKDKIFMC